MEEASVAGESPDRSKQRESSAEPTPGSASPVPEARGERDPRLAVAREDATRSASASPSTGQRGGVDTATKIFSIRELRDPEADAAGKAGGDAGETSEDADTSENAENADTQNPSAKSAKGGSEGDARLRAAVAAWVTSGSAGERPGGVDGPGGVEESAGGEAADATEDAETPAGSEAADAAESAEDAAATADGSAGDSKDAETPAGGEAADVPEDAETSTGGGAADTAESSEDAAATADGSAGDSKDPETPAEGPESGDVEGSGETSVADASKGAEGGQGADAGAAELTEGDSADAETESEGSGDSDGDGAEGEQVADAGADSEDDSEVDAAPEAAAAGKADADADATPETADDELVSGADRTSVTATSGEAAADADSRPEASDTGSGEAPKAAETADAGTAEADVDKAEAASKSAEGETSTAAIEAKPDGRPEAAGGKTATGVTEPKTDDHPRPAEGETLSDAAEPKSAEGETSADATEAKPDGRPEAAEGKTPTDATEPKTDTRPEAAEGEPAPGAVAAEGATDADPRTTDARTGTEDAAPATTPTGTDDPDADLDPQPQAATDEQPPKGPPAPGNETRTGGAGGKTQTAEGEAEAVDHPTAVFKAPRPPKPQVDQPTTMLKLGATKTPESAPERTSKFVALKPLDEPRTPRRDTPGRDTPRPDATRPVPQVGPEHTTQQPLPPKPPLDLLAELTNTPPPPETPVRTAIRRVKIWTPLVILLAIVFAVVQAVRPLPTPSLALTAEDSYTFDGSKVNLPWPSEGQGWMDVNGIGTMGDFGKQTPVAIGSVAKAMTAYIVLKDHPLKAGTEGEKITVDATAEKEGGYDKDGESTLNTVKAGDVLTEKQALSAIMIPSANNIARLLARWDAGSEAAFIKKMNDTAKSLGMTNTTYTDASGLKETTVSSAEDQVKLGNQLVKIQALMDITKLPSWVDPSGHKWTNYNRLVPYNNSLGIKTGTTTAAGGNLLFAATKEVGGETAVVVGAILGQHTAPIIDTVNAVSKTAMLAAQDAMTSAKILKKGTVVGYVDDQLGGHTPVVVTKDVAAVGWAGLKVKLSFAPDDVPHTAKAGTKVGTLTVGDGSSGAVKVPVALQKDLAEPALTAKLTRLG
ncbi:D-alanyl-D-alanine carboxypeptidase [Streptomyces sp. NPDC088196]|uniref:D-alanyl-D-alanine carboxypeptidase n=1 Tax=Streptomyces sp. NPDC088196 TaxID=3154868 RepID=UPI00344E3660